jgi:hypothetical protein
VSASEAYIKKIIVACLTDKGDADILTLVANKCSIVQNAPGQWICILRQRWYTKPRRQQVLHCPKCPWPIEYAFAPATLVHQPSSPTSALLSEMPLSEWISIRPSPGLGPLLLPRSELHRCRSPIPPRRHTHVALRWFSWRCTCNEHGSRLPEQPQSLHQLGSSQWAKRISTGPLPGLWYGSGGGGANAEGRWKPQSSLFQVCKKLGE